MATRTVFETPVGTWTHTTLGPGPNYIVVIQPYCLAPYRFAWAMSQEEASAQAERAYEHENDSDALIGTFAATSKTAVPDSEARKSIPGFATWVNR